MSRNQVVALLVLAALSAAAGAWFYLNFERVPYKQWVGFQGEARRNPYLAAERLLARMHVPARRARTPGELEALPPDGTLVLPDRREIITADARAQILAWIDGGGHLIVEDENVRLPDPILDALGVTRASTENSQKRAQRIVDARLPQAPEPMRVEMHSLQTLDAPQATVRVASAFATHLVHFPRGRGQVTVLNDLGFLRNAAIGANDHAEFLWQIVRFAPQTTAVVFFDSAQKLSLVGWLLDRAWAVLGAGGVLLALWLSRVAPRFGPLAPDPEPARRRLLDHLRASGRFQWSAGGARLLAESAREAALRRVARAQPDFTGLSRAEREQRLAAIFELDATDARCVLEPVQSTAAGDFMHSMRAFQRIHERLSRR